MALSRLHKFITTVFFLTLHMTSSAKTNSRPVYEVINEQSRADDKLITTSDSARLPYGNPLAGNSQQNARLHAHNQQAMFNAERIRQHKAQSQRWMKTPKVIDSYMRAYHESQESHQLALEQQQTSIKENQRKPAQHTREFIKRTQKFETDTTKLSKADTVVKPEKMRNQRSYSSVEYQQYLEPKRYQTIYITSPSSYVQGMTVKPNAINAIVHSQTSSKLYGEALSSENVFPKYYPTNDYKSVQDLETLNSLLSKNPGEQLSEFNALIKATEDNTGTHDKEVEMPIDLYFYLKDPSHKALSDHYDKTAYAQIPSTQETVKDHIPITEEVDDVENSEEITKSKVESISEQTPQLHLSTTKDIQYINSELTNQILSAGYNPLQEEQYDIKEYERKPSYEALRYGYQPTAYYSADEDNTEGDLSERYLHHNAKKGVQHLTNDGSGVSAYNDENVSIKIDSPIHKNISSLVHHLPRQRRSVLETEPFLLSNTSRSLKETVKNSEYKNGTEKPTAESLIRLKLIPNSNRVTKFGTFLTTPNFPIGEAIDYSEEVLPIYKIPKSKYGTHEIVYDELESDNYDDFSSLEYDYADPASKLSSIISIPHHNNFAESLETYAPSTSYSQNVELKTDFTKYKQIKRFPSLSSNIGTLHSSNGLTIPSTSYGVPNYGDSALYNTPHSFRAPVKYGTPNINVGLQDPEPVYLLTQKELAKLVGHHNLNIEHLEVYQLPRAKRPSHFPRKYKKGSPYRNRNFRKNILKLQKLNVI